MFVLEVVKLLDTSVARRKTTVSDDAVVVAFGVEIQSRSCRLAFAGGTGRELDGELVLELLGSPTGSSG
jgi:hypothetical protein